MYTGYYCVSRSIYICVYICIKSSTFSFVFFSDYSVFCKPKKKKKIPNNEYFHHSPQLCPLQFFQALELEELL